MELCGILPLAIALLGGRFGHHPHWDVSQYAEEFAATRDRLSELAADDRAVAAAFDMSYSAMPPQRQRLFRYLGLHPGPDTDAYATAALTGIPLPKHAGTGSPLQQPPHRLPRHRPLPPP
ncbi:hypothetical protein [Wenjunlia tyrosinilytica]|uniref:Uncharacterized protein n=1 Tax=Wenjunlia tyrosinilytica TaxID=1544741 RepID=A0A917ZZ48_9ACTN|nr:hypothetical protein [Wenjunlia tyrosinilytica]GGO99602.1 hypothetical protein GCM10012280_66420 [Wenjunlia tyrosinilytica]